MADQQTNETAQDAATPEASSSGGRPTFEQRSAAAEAMSKRQAAERTGEGGEPAPPAAKTEDAPDDSEGKSTDEAKPESTDEAKPEATDPAEKLDAVTKALQEGDLKLAAKLTGVSQKRLSTHGNRLATIRRREKDVDTKLSALDKREAAFHTERLRDEQTYGNPKKAKEAYDAGRYYEAAKYMGAVFNDSFTTITQKIARETAGLSKEKIAELEEREKFQREKREFEENKRREAQRSKTTQSRSQQLATLKSKLADHPVVKAEQGTEAVSAQLERMWDDKIGGFKNGLTPGQALKKAADSVLDRKRAEAIALGIVPAAPAPVAKKAPPAAETQTVEAGDAKRAAGKAGKQRLTFEERMALAKRKTERQRGRA